jgi:hypothetical protein
VQELRRDADVSRDLVYWSNLAMRAFGRSVLPYLLMLACSMQRPIERQLPTQTRPTRSVRFLCDLAGNVKSASRSAPMRKL